MDIKQRIQQFIVENFYVAEASQLADDTSLIETGIVDSTGVLEVVAFLETDFHITVADQDILPANLDSISSMAAFVTRAQTRSS
jgi:acyl carrier protein